MLCRPTVLPVAVSTWFITGLPADVDLVDRVNLAIVSDQRSFAILFVWTMHGASQSAAFVNTILKGATDLHRRESTAIIFLLGSLRLWSEGGSIAIKVLGLNGNLVLILVCFYLQVLIVVVRALIGSNMDLYGLSWLTQVWGMSSVLLLRACERFIELLLSYWHLSCWVIIIDGLLIVTKSARWEERRLVFSVASKLELLHL